MEYIELPESSLSSACFISKACGCFTSGALRFMAFPESQCSQWGPAVCLAILDLSFTVSAVFLDKHCNGHHTPLKTYRPC